MKTFDKRNLITWYNREKAVIGNEYYFGNCLYDIKNCIKEGIYTVLTVIDNNCYNYPFHIKKDNSSGKVCCACLLPVDAVKKVKTYRPCRTVHELYDLIFNIKSKTDTELYINELLGVNIHFRDKETGTEYFTTISTITKDINDYVKVVISPKGYLSFTDLFNKYEIEVEGEFKPFGVTDET